MSFFKNIILLSLLFAFVLFVNWPVISFNMIYVEQPTLYVANHLIHSWRDLLNIYLFPKLLDMEIPFFRPTGHFLIYQLITPYLGWLNNQAFIMINFFFLTCTGFYLIKLYALLFPRMKIGGYIAFSFYLMYPALTLSRFMVLHFEFMHVFFTTLSLYYFIQFWQSNLERIQNKNPDLLHIGWFLAAICFYIIACTCKEGAVLLGMVWLCFMLIDIPIVEALKIKPMRQVIILIMVITLSMFTYLTLPWPGLLHPDKPSFEFLGTLRRDIKLLGYIVSFHQFTTPGISVWGSIASPFIARIIVWGMLAACVISRFILPKDNIAYKKLLLFLYCGTAIFLTLPMLWGMGMPWHLSLALLTLCLIGGFSIEILITYMLPTHPKQVRNIGAFFACCIGLSAISVNNMNINLKESEIGGVLSLMRNAILHPPPIKHLLNNNSVIVVEDSIFKKDYDIGNSYYPVFYRTKFEYQRVNAKNLLNIVKIENTYNGRLFQQAYLMPTLREEEVPFQIEKMNQVPDVIIYGWLRQLPNIFCFGYDKQGNWFDRTGEFKKQLQVEKNRRHMHPGFLASLSSRKSPPGDCPGTIYHWP